ncbi:hypothetical protein ADL00_38970 [Streptomyces sp. AS58]|nr:hypothetical protein ADL00_38970 [Streptomyces sp. AS58]
MSVTSRRTPGSSRPSRRGRWARSVTTIRHSVCRMSRASSGPRRVGLMPATAAPANAAAPSHSGYSGVLSSSTPTCGWAWRGSRSARSAARAAAPAATSCRVSVRSSNHSPGRSSPHCRPTSSATVSMRPHGN